MEHRTTTDPEEQLERTGDELKERLETLDDHIDDARREAQARRPHRGPTPRDAGSWDADENDGEDPGGFDDPEAEDEDEEE